MSADVVVLGAQKLVRRIDQMQHEITHRKDAAARAAANLLKVVMRQEAPYRRGTGRRHLRGSIRVRRVPGGWRVKPESRVAHLVIKGVAAHTVAPRRKEALHFFAGGSEIFSRSASPRGFGGNPFVERTRAIAAGEAKAIAGAVLFHGVPDPNEGA